jgi:O-antigen ligase
VEFSVFGSVGHGIDVRDIGLTDDDGRPVLVNGNFGHGLDRWVFTDDRHVAWRMLNQYLMLFFETGVLGVTAFIALAGLAFAGGIRAVRAGGAGGAVRAGGAGRAVRTGGAGGAVRTGGAGRAVRAGCIDGAAVAGAVAGFMISSLFDNVLEAPRLATLFFLICLCGLMHWEADRPRPD